MSGNCPAGNKPHIKHLTGQGCQETVQWKTNLISSTSLVKDVRKLSSGKQTSYQAPHWSRMSGNCPAGNKPHIKHLTGQGCQETVQWKTNLISSTSLVKDVRKLSSGKQTSYQAPHWSRMSENCPVENKPHIKHLTGQGCQETVQRETNLILGVARFRRLDKALPIQFMCITALHYVFLPLINHHLHVRDFHQAFIDLC